MKERGLMFSSRARAIRAVVAAQWGVAISLMFLRAADEHTAQAMGAIGAVAEPYLAGIGDSWASAASRLADLPTAEQIVTEVTT